MADVMLTEKEVREAFNELYNNGHKLLELLHIFLVKADKFDAKVSAALIEDISNLAFQFGAEIAVHSNYFEPESKEKPEQEEQEETGYDFPYGL